MRKLGRFLLWLLGGFVLIACMLLLGVNLYVQSQGTHRRIQQELSQRLGTPLTLRRVSVTPWSGLKLNGITIPQEPGKVPGDFLQARSFQLRVRFLSLFSDRLVIRQVSLIKPEVVWAQNSAGKWRLPALPPEKVAALAPNPSVTNKNSTGSPPATTSVPSPAPELSPNENRTKVAAPGRAFTPEVQRVSLRDGDFTFLDPANRVVAKFSGLDFTSSFRTATAVKGSARIAKISLRDRFFIEHLDSALHYDPATLVFSSISAKSAGGELSGDFAMQLQAVDSPFRASVKFRDVQAGTLLANAGGPRGMIEGRIEGHLDASGKTADSNALNGRGDIFLRDGKLEQYSLLVALGQILQIDELMQLHLEQAELHFHITPGVVLIDQLLLRSANIRLTARGTIDFNGRMHLASQLAINDRIRNQLFTAIRENFQPLGQPPGYAAVDFKIGGTVAQPRTDLMEKVVGHDLHDLGGVINSFFGHAKKPKARGAPAPAPSPSPNENKTDTMPNESKSNLATPAASLPAAPTP